MPPGNALAFLVLLSANSQIFSNYHQIGQRLHPVINEREGCSTSLAELKHGAIESRCDTSIWRALPLDTGKRLTSLSIRFPPNPAKLKKSQQAAWRWRTSARLSSISRTMVCRPAGGARQGYGRTAMRVKLLAITSLVASGVIVTAFFVQSLSSSSARRKPGRVICPSTPPLAI